MLCSRRPHTYSRLGSLKMEPWTIPVDSYPMSHPPLSYLALQKIHSPDVVAFRHPQGIANALRYLKHHLHKLTERQNVSENNINTTLVALTAQLVANSPPLPVSNTPSPPIPSPPVSPPPTPMARQMHPKLSCPPDFGRERHNGHVFLNSCFLYICLALE